MEYTKNLMNCLKCHYRNHENGNCVAVGGFCTAVPAAYCPLIPELLARCTRLEDKFRVYSESELEKGYDLLSAERVSMNAMYEVGLLQQIYWQLVDGGESTEKSLQELLSRFRDRHDLTDDQTLMIAKNATSILQMAKMLKVDDSMSGWVSVETQKPDAEVEVRILCVTSSGHEYQCQGFYEPSGAYREDSDYSWDYECCGEYDEERDDYMIKTGWYETIHNWDDYQAVWIGDTVTHWMPLPKGP